jgi:hypothetical protein
VHNTCFVSCECFPEWVSVAKLGSLEVPYTSRPSLSPSSSSSSISGVILNHHNDANPRIQSCGPRAKSCFSSWAWTIRNGETPHISKTCCQHFSGNVRAISMRRISRENVQATSMSHDRCFDIPSGRLSAPSTTRNESVSGT